MIRRILNIFALFALMVSSAMAQTFSVSSDNSDNSVLAEPGGWTEVHINLEGAEEMTALQFCVSLPECVTLDRDWPIHLGNATNGHTLNVSTLDSGDLLVVIYSLHSATFSDGTLLSFTVTAGEEATSAQGNLHTIRTATLDAMSHECDDVVFSAAVVNEEPVEPEAKYYWYLGTEKPTDDAFIEANGTPINGPEDIPTLTWTSAEYIYFVYPKEFGKAVIVDDGGDEAGGKAVESLSTVNLTEYRGWRFNKDNQGIEYTVSFKEEEEEPAEQYYYYLGASTDESLITPDNYKEFCQMVSEFPAEQQTINFDNEYLYVVLPADKDIFAIDPMGGEAVFSYYSSKHTRYIPERRKYSRLAFDDGKEYVIYRSNGTWIGDLYINIKEEVPVTSIVLGCTEASMKVEESIDITATVNPQDATWNKLMWSSDNASVATVDNNGKVTALAEGSTTITAEACDNSGITATCVVTVEAAAVEPEPTVASGEYYLYHAESKRFLARGEHWGTCATVNRYGIPFVWTAEEYSLKFLDSNVCLFETDDNNIYTDNASTGFAFEYTEGGYLLKSQKSDRYLTIVDKAHNHQIVNVTNDATAATLWQPMTKAEHDAIVAGYVEENYANVIAAAGLTATAGDFIDYLATLNAEDKTSAIGTARFAGSAGEWKFTELRHQDWQPAYGTDFCELWQATGYYTQTITGLAKGIYKVTMQGYERTGGWAECNALGAQGYEITTATLSANGEEVNLKSWYSGKSGEDDPDNTGQAVAKFNEGKYMNELYTYVGEDGTLDLMVNIPSHVGGNWVLFNNFTLTHYSADVTDIESSVLEAQGSQLIYDLTGRRVEKAEKGIYIVNGKKVVVK